MVTLFSHDCFKPQQRQLSPWVQIKRDVAAIALEGPTRLLSAGRAGQEGHLF